MNPWAVHRPEALGHVRTARADKIAAARTTPSVRTRAARAAPQAFLAVLERRQPVGGPVVEGDALAPAAGRPPAQA